MFLEWGEWNNLIFNYFTSNSYKCSSCSFSDKFIFAEVVSFEDFAKFQGWKNIKEKGKARLEGKEDVVQDGDVILFKHGA